jgi:hypothetical protein
MSNNTIEEKQGNNNPMELHSDDEDYLPPIPKFRRITLSLEDRERLYMQHMSETIDSVLTESQRKKYCVIFGESCVLGEFDSREEAVKAQNDVWKNLLTILYVPQ